MASTITRTTWTDDDGSATTGTIINNAELQLVYDKIDQMFAGSGSYTTFTFGGLLRVDGFGSHLYTAGGTGGNSLSVRNTTSGAANYASFQLNAGTLGGGLYARSQGYTPSGFNLASQILVYSDGAGGIGYVADNAAGTHRWFIQSSEAMRIHASRAVSIGTTTDTGAGTLYVGAGLIVGTNPAAAGLIRIPNSQSMYARNAANGADVQLIGLDASNIVKIGLDGNVAQFGHDIVLPATNKLRLDGSASGNTYLEESAADTVRLTVGGSTAWTVVTTGMSLASGLDLAIAATKKLFLDGGGNTYFQESAADVLDCYAGGNQIWTVPTTTADFDVINYLRLATKTAPAGGGHGPMDASWSVDGYGDIGSTATLKTLGHPALWLRVKNRATGTIYAIPAYSS